MIQKSLNSIFYELIMSRHRLQLFRKLPWKKQGKMLLRLPQNYRDKMLKQLRPEEIADIINVMEPELATDLMQHIENKRRVLPLIQEKKKDKIVFLSQFDPNTAAGVMSLDFVAVSPRTTFKKVAQIIRRYESNAGKFPTILVVQGGKLLGELQGHAIAIASPGEAVRAYVRKVPEILKDETEKKIISLFKRYRHNKIVVVNRDKKVMGIIYSDSIVKILQKQSANQLYKFAGVSHEEDVLDSAYTKVKSRYKWLIINLLTCFLAAGVVSLFEKTISAIVLLAIYMPVVAGMGGNAATQTLAVVVRGLALKEIGAGIAKRVIVQEVIAGCVNGLINGIIVALVAWFWNKSLMFGAVVGIAMIINLMVAGFFGTLIPIIMKKLGYDPASSATIFITTATDVIGFFVFLGLASVMLL